MRTPVRAAFTLIELLIVVVIIGILATIAIPKFANTKEKAYSAAMRTDLRNLATAQESYFYTNAVYSTDPVALGITTSQGVVITIPEGTTSGWSAFATHPNAPGYKCALYIGTAAAVAPATVDGQITCN